MPDAAILQRQMVDAVLARDFDTLRALYHPDYTYTDGEGEQKGADVGVAVAETYSTAFPDLQMEIRAQYSPSPDVAIMEIVARGTHEAELAGIPATGKSVEVIVCNIVETADDLIVREREYYDGLSMMRQLGVVE